MGCLLTGAKLSILCTTGWPKKVSYYQESSLNRIKNRQCGYISHQLWV